MAKFDFTNRRGLKLTGQLETPDDSPVAYAVFAHCFTCSKNVRAASFISKRLSDFGFAVLRFDFTGLGNSEGDFANSNFSSNVTDLVDAAAALEEQFSAPSLIVGHSLGGAAAIMAAKQIESIRAVATIGAPSEPAHVQHLFGDAVAKIQSNGAATVSIGGRDLTIEKHFLEDIQSNRIAPTIKSLDKPLIIFHSPDDKIVSIDNARKLYEAAWHPKSFVSVDGADHMLSNTSDAHFVAETLAAWAGRYIPETSNDKTESAEPGPKRSPGEVEVREVDGGLTQAITTAEHNFHADEPAAVGGSGWGPNPYELLLSSLGACTSMTLRMYARRKQWPLETVSVRLKHSRVHAEDCESCETESGLVDRIEKQIVVGGDLDSKQIARLAEIADRCPVHRTLLGEIRIESKIKASNSREA